MVRFDGDMASMGVMIESLKTEHDTKHFTLNVAIVVFSFCQTLTCIRNWSSIL